MKKLSILVSLCLILLCLLLTACSGGNSLATDTADTTGEFDPAELDDDSLIRMIGTLDGEREVEVREAIGLPERVEISNNWLASAENSEYRYYGTFNDCAVIFQEGVTTAITHISVAGTTFTHVSGFQIYACKDGKCYSLEKAYELGYLDRDDIAVIAEWHKRFDENETKR